MNEGYDEHDDVYNHERNIGYVREENVQKHEVYENDIDVMNDGHGHHVRQNG